MLCVEKESVADYTLHIYPDICQSVFSLLSYLSLILRDSTRFYGYVFFLLYR